MKRILIALAALLPMCAAADTTAPSISVPVSRMQYNTDPYSGSYQDLPSTGTVSLPGGTFLQYGELQLQVLDAKGEPLVYDAATGTLTIPATGTRISVQCASQATGLTYALKEVTLTQTGDTGGWAPAYYVPLVADNATSAMTRTADGYSWTEPDPSLNVIELSLVTSAPDNAVTVVAVDTHNVELPPPVITGPPQGFTGTQHITITTDVTGGSIYYSLDNQPATTSSTLYTGPFEVTTSAFVYAIVYYPGGYTSPQAFHFFYAQGGVTGVDDPVVSDVRCAYYDLSGRPLPAPRGLCVERLPGDTARLVSR